MKRVTSKICLKIAKLVLKSSTRNILSFTKNSGGLGDTEFGYMRVFAPVYGDKEITLVSL